MGVGQVGSLEQVVGPEHTADRFENTGVTVLATPVLCHWFESSWYEYGKQFAKFGAGYLLSSPEELSRIPALVEEFKITSEIRGRLMTAIGSERFEEVLSGRKVVREGSR